MNYRATLNLPQTDFKMKASLAQNEPVLLAAWEKEDLYGRMQAAATGRPLYILHDGPPYANGHIHMGTAFNKVLKDIILKSKRMAGYNCPYVPGWDCHGLPIEHQVDKELGKRKKELGKLAVRQECRKFATKWMSTQREEFKRLGVLAEWDAPYLTMSYDYEAVIAREFNNFLISGAVVRSKKPVYWCSSCTTALAEAEVEYYDHTSPSIYVKFSLLADLSGVAPALSGKAISLVIWTTTPWTLPGNLGIALHPDYTYAAVAVKDEVWIMAEDLVVQAFAQFGIIDYEVIATLPAVRLEGLKCRHPLLTRESLVILASYVTLDVGTGCVHTAPGHGREDYISGIKYDLPILSPVDHAGRFTDEAGPYSGLFILDANKKIIFDLAERNALVRESVVNHSYPHCWRCKRPVFFRATAQWFISLEHDNLRQKALDAIREVNWTPRWGMERIYGMVESRPDWCLSRQRVWGVPITVFYCEKCGEVVRDKEVAKKIVKIFSEQGADAWFGLTALDLLGEGARCVRCGNDSFIKEEDILDVWFDSGVSYAAVLEDREGLRTPADLYLEGSDQHRGWFHSSLLASVGTRGVPPYRGVLTHGFVVDGQGKKMSKSLGNVIAPAEIIKEHGAEILRLWVSAEDYRDDIKISNEILRHLTDAYRKIRNTIRYLLGNLYDFAPDTDMVPYQDMDDLDQWALHQLEVLKDKVMRVYEDFEFHIVYHALHNFCVVTMSSLYLDIIKDRLYTEPARSRARKSAQTVLYEILDTLIRLMAPVLSFTAAEVWSFLPFSAKQEGQVFFALFPEKKADHINHGLNKEWERLWIVRSEITKALELARREKRIGHSLDAAVELKATGEWTDFLARHLDKLKMVSIVSRLSLVEEITGEVFQGEVLPELSIRVIPATGAKCERCWIISGSVGIDLTHPNLCSRCSTVMAGQS